jgi:hypothetical protein
MNISVVAGSDFPSPFRVLRVSHHNPSESLLQFLHFAGSMPQKCPDFVTLMGLIYFPQETFDTCVQRPLYFFRHTGAIFSCRLGHFLTPLLQITIHNHSHLNVATDEVLLNEQMQ